MANKEHLEIRKQGVEAWNEWGKNTELTIRTIEGKGLGVTCDRDVECLSGNCFAYSGDEQRCHAEGEEQPAITGDVVEADLAWDWIVVGVLFAMMIILVAYNKKARYL